MQGRQMRRRWGEGAESVRGHLEEVRERAWGCLGEADQQEIGRPVQWVCLSRERVVATRL